MKTFEMSWNAEFSIQVKASTQDEAIFRAEKQIDESLKLGKKKVHPYSVILVEDSISEKVKPVKFYAYKNLAGCVTQRKSHESGGLVGLYHAKQAEVVADNPWITVCEIHGQMVSHMNLQLAYKELPRPSSWCSACRGDGLD